MSALILALLALAADPLPKVIGRDFEVTDTETGAILRGQRTVPYAPEQACYEWVVRVKPEARSIFATETFTLPDRAKWDVLAEEGTQVAADGRSAVTTFADDLSDGELRHGWCVAQDDPPGSYHIAVTVDGRPFAAFDFTLLPGPDAT